MLATLRGFSRNQSDKSIRALPHRIALTIGIHNDNCNPHRNGDIIVANHSQPWRTSRSLRLSLSTLHRISRKQRHRLLRSLSLGPEEIRSYQVYLTNEKKLAPSSIIIALAALRFLYTITLRKDWCLEEVIPIRFGRTLSLSLGTPHSRSGQ